MLGLGLKKVGLGLGTEKVCKGEAALRGCALLSDVWIRRPFSLL